jgi:Virulence factor membrane-bound polymerase, C-terminal/O-Antigen ligase/Protein glycosylation ligase
VIKPLIVYIAALCLLISWLIPHHYYPWLTGDSEFLAFAAVVVVSFILFYNAIIIPRAAVLFALTAAIPLIQWLSGIIFFSGDAVIAACYLLGLSAVILVGFNLARDEATRIQSYQILANVFIFGALISTGIALRQWLGFSQGYSFFEAANSGSRPFANLGQANNLATLLCMGLASTLYLLEQHRLRPAIAGTLALLLIFGVALTQSRTAWLGAIFAAVWWAWKTRYFSPRFSARGMICWVGVFVLMVVCLPFLTSTLTTLTPVGVAERIQASGRGLLWAQFSLAVLHGPLWGYGWNQISVAQVSVSDIFPTRILANSSHNILLDLLVWNGPILGSVIIIVTAAWIIRLGYVAKSSSSVCALMAIGFALIHGMLEYPLQYAYLLLPVGLLLGMVYGELSGTPRYLQTLAPSTYFTRLPKLSWTMPPAAFAGFLGVCTVCIMWLGFEYHTLQRDYRVIKPIAFVPNQTTTTTYKPDHIMVLNQLRDYLRLQSTNPTPNMTEQQLDWAREVAYRFPQIEHLTRYATALALNNQPIQAGQTLGKLRILYGNRAFTHAAQRLRSLQQAYADQNLAALHRCERSRQNDCRTVGTPEIATSNPQSL